MNGDVFIKLYLDEDVDVLVADLLRAQSFEVFTTSELGHKSKSDPEQLEYAVAEKLTIVTHNRTDFEKLAQRYFDSGTTHFGIVIAVQRAPHEIAARLLGILNNFTADEMVNQIHYI